MKRYIALLLSVILLVSFFVPSVSAYSDLYPEHMTDFIANAATGFWFDLRGQSGSRSYASSSPTVSLEGDYYSVTLSMESTSTVPLDRLELSFTSSVAPSGISLINNGSTYPFYSVSDSFSLYGYDLYSYMAWSLPALSGTISIQFIFPSNTVTDLSVLSLFGYSWHGFSITSASLRLDAKYQIVVPTTETIFDRSDVSLPSYNSYFWDRDDNNQKDFVYSHAYITVSSDSYNNTSYIDKIYFRVRSISDPYAPAVTLINSDDTIASVIPADRISSWSEQFYYSGTSNVAYIDCVFEVDLSGYYLGDVDILLSYSIDPVTVGAQGDYSERAVVFSVQDIVVTFPVSDVPWYSTFFLGISDLFTNLTSSISGFFSNMISTVTDGFNRLEDLLEVLVYGDQEAADEFAQEGQQASDSLGAASDVLGNVNQPEVSPDNLFSQFLNLNTNGLAILSMMTSNSYVTDILILVFTFALAGYIFFGKKA